MTKETGPNITSCDEYPLSDEKLIKLYPPSIQALDTLHWTPAGIARQAAQFLGGEGAPKILDIGSGVGKFCLAAACHTPNAQYVGVEQRWNLVEYAQEAQRALNIQNVSFIHSNFTQLDLADFDHFYFYNAFFENISEEQKIDENIEYTFELYNYYTLYLFNGLNSKPAGTRLCTYSGWGDEVPPGFKRTEPFQNSALKFWIKE